MDDTWIDAVVRADHALGDAISVHVPARVLEAFAWATHLGDPWLLGVLCVVGGVALWCNAHRMLAASWVLAIAGNAVLNKSLKSVFERARPADDVMFTAAQGYSFPSGNTSGAMVAYGMAAYLAWRLLPARWQPLAITASVLVIFTVACSRVLLRVHFASDVVAGCVSGGLWLLACIASAEIVRRYRAGSSPDRA